MLTNREKSLVGQAYRALCASRDDFTPREQQKSLISFVASTFGDGEISLAEAPTGTGKSIGYLLPGIIMAISRDKRLIVSTATTALQDQLFQKDIPLALAALAEAGLIDVRVAVAKGRERHVCPMRLDAVVTQGDLFAVEDARRAQLEAIAQTWTGGDWNGLVDTLPTRPARSIWLEVANTSASCTGDGCSHRQSCPYYAALDEAAQARVIVTNHDYLLTSLANDTSSVVCDSENNLYAFDEAHHLQDKVLAAFARRLDLLDQPFDGLRRLAPMFKACSHHLEQTVERLSLNWATATQAVSAMLGDGHMHRFTLGESPIDFHLILDALMGSLREVIDALNLCMESVSAKGQARQEKSAFRHIAMSLCRSMKFDLASYLDCLSEFTAADTDRARWLSRTKHALEIKCSPFDSSNLARKHLWPRIESAILTSATITTLGSFTATVRSLGLDAHVKTIRLDSPLDYSRAKLRVPRLCLEAGAKGHLEVSVAQIRRNAFSSDDVGTLVYFTSRRMLQAVFDALTPSEQDIVLRQGDLSASAMVAEHMRRIDAGSKSVMFGLDSLGEGIDLPGRYCTKVFIPRLPFPSPEDPILATHAEHLTRKGLQPFQILQLPRAGLKLAQICGRLIRRNGDWGDVVVLDNRMRTKRYGRQLLAGTAFTTISY